MQRALRLWDLQTVDSDLDRLRGELGQVEAQLGETDELRAARDAVQQQTVRVQHLESQQRSLELDAQALRARIKEIEDRLYSGKVTSIKEMQGYQEEVEQFRRQQSNIEDQELAVIDQTEAAQAELRRLQLELEQIEARWRADQGDLVTRRDELRNQIARREGDRAAAVAAVQPADLDRYENLRRRKQGRAVAKVSRGFCGACRVDLPNAVLQHVRTSPQPVSCPSCERLLAPA